MLPFLTGAPTWAVPMDRPRTSSPKNLPGQDRRQKSGWRAFAAEAVRRYGPSGTFWTDNPRLPRRPIRTWQVWNEPNFKYFVARPNPAEYGKLVKLSYSALKARRPGREADPRRPLRAAR